MRAGQVSGGDWGGVGSRASERPAQRPDTQRFQRRRGRRRFLAGAEWVCLLFGLLALDVCIWVYTSSTLDQAYQDWAFDQTLLGAKPSVPGFIADEIGWLFGQNRAGAGGEERAEKLDSAEKPRTAPKELENGLLLGRLRISRLKVAVMVREGATESTLRRAVGHVPGTALPGNIGNVGLAGHRDTFFRPLRQIRAGDRVTLQTPIGLYRYVVEWTAVVNPSDTASLKATPDRSLTLVTCYPFRYVGPAPQRFIVRARQVAPGANNS